MPDKKLSQRLATLLLAGILILPGLALAEVKKHGHDSASAASAVCAKENAMPSLRCAYAPSAVFDRRGRLWLAWAYGGHAYVNYSDDKGQSYSPPVAVNVVPEMIAARAENRPKIEIDRQGHVYVSWTQKLPARFSGHIRFSYSVDGGRRFTEPITVNDHREMTSHRFESLAVNERGDIYIAWLDKRDRLEAEAKGGEYRGAALYYAVSTDGGKSFSKNQKVLDHSCECCRTAMVIDRDGLPVILWRHIFDKNTRDHALVKFVSPTQPGKVVRASYDYWRIDGCPHHGPAISIADDGIYHLAWFNNAPKRHGLFYVHSSDQGQRFSGPLNFGNYQARASHPQVLSLGEKVYLAWQEFDGQHALLITMRSNDGGRQWSEPERMAEADGGTDYPLLLSDNDRVYLAWHRRGQAYQLFPLNEP